MVHMTYELRFLRCPNFLKLFNTSISGVATRPMCSYEYLHDFISYIVLGW